jgi:uncharacterized protein
MLRPVTDTDGAPFWEYAARGELRVQACAGCGELRFPPRPCCPHCQSFEAEWRRVSGRGRVWSYVDLVAGPGEPVNSLATDRLRIGTRVRAVFDDGLPRWVPERP